MKIAVSGASGFIGTAICKELLKQKHTVVALARDPLKVQFSTEIKFFLLEEAEDINLSGIDAVIHTAAYVPKSEDSSEDHQCMVMNLLGTKKILDASKRDGVKTFVHFSTGNIYQCTNKLEKVSETFAIDTNFRSIPYLRSKAAGDDFALNYKCKDLRTVVLRPSTIYSPGTPQELLQRVAQKIKNEIKLEPEDVGNYYLDLVHMDDVVDATIAVIANDKCSGAYNIGGDEPGRTVDIANLFCFFYNKRKLMVNNLGEPELNHAVLDITKAKSDFEYKPRKLSDGLKQYYSLL
ncbi:MAG TPA: NAD(P)-dependent oxidoreductase [Anaerovoracaceae bacterium]|nr:NAD(P)-dependent oxidoreductase [Anaerovoracaceae bacterium]